MRTRSLLLPALAATAIALGACGDDGEGDQGGAAAGQPATTEQAPATTAAETPPAGGNAAARIAERIEAEGRPKIPRPSGAPPAELQQADVERGDGAVLRAGDTVSVQYAGASWSTGEEFDASYGGGQPFEFPLGGGMVIPGWDEGVQGMRVGGRRVLVIPPDLGYGAEGSPPVIAPNETLVFVIDAEGAGGG